MNTSELKDFLDEKVYIYNKPEFIQTDPIQIPHNFSRKEDIEISAFLTAILSWGNRKTIINKSTQLMKFMDSVPYDFVTNFEEKENHKLLYDFKHRTFNGTDLLFFIQSLNNIYLNKGGLEKVFTNSYKNSYSIKDAIISFQKIFFEIPAPARTRKHIPDIVKHSSAKRINMFLRWMVRKDNNGVDFGIWNDISAADIYLPLDIHTGNVSRFLGLLSRKQDDWKSVVELTNNLKKFDENDPVKYDYALFGMGIFEKIA